MLKDVFVPLDSSRLDCKSDEKRTFSGSYKGCFERRPIKIQVDSTPKSFKFASSSKGASIQFDIQTGGTRTNILALFFVHSFPSHFDISSGLEIVWTSTSSVKYYNSTTPKANSQITFTLAKVNFKAFTVKLHGVKKCSSLHKGCVGGEYIIRNPSEFEGRLFDGNSRKVEVRIRKY